MIQGNFYAIAPEDAIIVKDNTPLYARRSKLGYAITVINDMGEKPVREWLGRTQLSTEMSNVIHFMKTVASHINSADQSEQDVIAQWPKNHFLLQDHFSISSSIFADELRFIDDQRLSSFAIYCETIQKIVPDFTIASVLKRALQERIAPQDKKIVTDFREELGKSENLDKVEELNNTANQNRSWSSIIKPSLLCVGVMIAIYFCYSQLYLKKLIKGE